MYDVDDDMDDDMDNDDDDSDVSPIRKAFEKYGDAGEYLEFDRIPENERPSNRPDLCAFILLDKLFPAKNKQDIVAGAEHDEIHLAINEPQLLESKITDKEILYLVRCGVRLGEWGLCMFA